MDTGVAGACRPCTDEACLSNCSEDAECAGEADCGGDQTCADGGNCFFECGADADCPLDRVCLVDEGGLCYFQFCGPSEGNGEIFGECTLGEDLAGTCAPIARGDPLQPNPDGICFEAGNALEGTPCDAQARGRGAADRDLQCGVGMICWDDPDDVLGPRLEGNGRCVRYCDPEGAGCGAGFGA